VKAFIYFIALISMCACDIPLRHMEPESQISNAVGNIVPLGKTLNVEIIWHKGPFGLPNKASFLEVRLLDQNLNLTSTSEGDQFYIQADMGMGHGLANAGDFYGNEDLNIWINDTLSFYMGGNYLLKLYLFDENFNELGVAEWRVVF